MGHDITSWVDLPEEVLNLIITFVYANNVTIAFGKHLEWFAKCFMILNKRVHAHSMKFLLHYCRFTCPQNFYSFNTSYASRPDVYRLIRILDFQEFTSIGLGRTNRMNSEIQMVTKDTILHFLSRSTNLREFLSSENIQNDISSDILQKIFFELPHLDAIDFCGSTGTTFTDSFREIMLKNSFDSVRLNLTKLSFHDCIDIPDEFFVKFLPLVPNLTRLDVYHTNITGDSLFAINPNCRLTHLNLGCCYKIEKKDILKFFIRNESPVTKHLKFLSLDADNVNDLSSEELFLVLNKLDGASLEYLNCNGREINCKILELIKKKFLNLKSIHLQHTDFSVQELIEFLRPIPEFPVQQRLRFINVKGNSNVSSAWSLTNPVLIESCPTLLAWEFDLSILENSGTETFQFDFINDVGYKSDMTMSEPKKSSYIWKIFQTNGRRSWFYKLRKINETSSSSAEPIDYFNYKYNLDKSFNCDTDVIDGESAFDYEVLTNNPDYVPNTVKYDPETGKRIEPNLIFYPFLKYASKKIDLSNGPFYTGSNERFQTWPVRFSERGIYKYYALNI